MVILCCTSQDQSYDHQQYLRQWMHGALRSDFAFSVFPQAGAIHIWVRDALRTLFSLHSAGNRLIVLCDLFSVFTRSTLAKKEKIENADTFMQY